MSTTDFSLTTEDILLLKLEPLQTFEIRNLVNGSLSPWKFIEFNSAGPWRTGSIVDTKDWHLIIQAANSIMEMHGIEPLVVNDKLIASYVNTGETYAPTVLYDHANERFLVTSWGQFLEDWQAANLIED